MPVLEVSHTIEMGHRLSKHPDSKCFHLHGHTWIVTLRLTGPVNKVEDWTIDFGEVKCAFRKYLDETYDHKMLLNANDPLFGVLSAGISTVSQFGAETPDEQVELLGLVYTTVGDPTVENFAYAILEWAKNTFPRMFSPGVKVQEGPINGIIVGDWS